MRSGLAPLPWASRYQHPARAGMERGEPCNSGSRPRVARWWRSSRTMRSPRSPRWPERGRPTRRLAGHATPSPLVSAAHPWMTRRSRWWPPLYPLSAPPHQPAPARMLRRLRYRQIARVFRALAGPSRLRWPPWLSTIRRRPAPREPVARTSLSAASWRARRWRWCPAREHDGSLRHTRPTESG